MTTTTWSQHKAVFAGSNTSQKLRLHGLRHAWLLAPVGSGITTITFLSQPVGEDIARPVDGISVTVVEGSWVKIPEDFRGMFLDVYLKADASVTTEVWIQGTS